MRTLLTCAALAVTAVLAFGAGPASAAKSCGRAVINDWYVDGTIDARYPPHCYREALGRVPEQQRIYSDLPEKLDRALTDALRRQAPGHVKGARHISISGSSTASGPIQRVLGELGPARADSVPIPLLVLAGFALLLVAAGAVSAVLRRLNGRRIRSD